MARTKNRMCESCLSMIKVNDVSIKCKNLTCKKTWHSACAEKTFNVDLNDIVSSFRWTCPECRGSKCKYNFDQVSEKDIKSTEVWVQDKISGDNQTDMSNLDSKVLLKMLVADQKDSQKVLLVLTSLMKELLQEKSQMKNLTEENEELRKAMITHLLQDKLELKHISEENESLKQKLFQMNERMVKIEHNTMTHMDNDDLLTTDESLEHLPAIQENISIEKSELSNQTYNINTRENNQETTKEVCYDKPVHKVVTQIIKPLNETGSLTSDKTDDQPVSVGSKETNNSICSENPGSFEMTKRLGYDKFENPAVFPSKSSINESENQVDIALVQPMVKTPSTGKRNDQKRIEICVGRIAKSTPLETINNYIAKRIPKSKFTCDIFNPNGFYANFKISVDVDYKDKLLANSFWPPNVIVRRLYLRK